MAVASQSKYFVIGNRPIATTNEIVYKNWPNQTVYDWYVKLPVWFKQHNGKKIIKFYGGNVERVNQTVTLFNGEHTQNFERLEHITIHSNIASFSNSGFNGYDFDEGSEPTNAPYMENWGQGRTLYPNSSDETGPFLMIQRNKIGVNKTELTPIGHTGGGIWTGTGLGIDHYLYDCVYPNVDLYNYYGDYIMLANNFFTPKLYDLTTIHNIDSNGRDFKIWFRDHTGNPLPILDIKTGEPVKVNTSSGVSIDSNTVNISQLVFKIECELMVV
jgi:hypothetical protein